MSDNLEKDKIEEKEPQKVKIKDKGKKNGVLASFKKGTSRVGKFFTDTKSELKKIVWPSRKQVINNTGIVLGVVAIVGLFLFGLDSGMRFLLDLVL